jgi:flagellar biosynthesis anti-sigma factor FlgM
MSYSNGIGDLRQALGAIAPASTKETQKISTENAMESRTVTSRGTPDDETRLSSTAGLVAQTLEGSDVRADKVAALQQAIASGQYNISSPDVAEKMIQSLLD